MNTEIQKIIQLLESKDKANVLLALQLAQHCQSEFEKHYGAAVEDCQSIIDWVWKYDAEVENPLLATNLNLDHNQLTNLPTQIGKLKNLTRLDLYDNQLSSLPAQIGELKNLTELYLEGNQLSSLPAQIGELKNLTVLDLSYNQLSSLPAQIGELKNLSYFNLRNNQLRSLPAQIGELKALEHLFLEHNPLQSLPDSLLDIPNVAIYVAGNPDLKVSDELRNSGKLIFE